MTPFAHAPVLGIHRLAGADVGTYLDLTMRYARADDGSPRILDSMMQHDADCPCLAAILPVDGVARLHLTPAPQLPPTSMRVVAPDIALESEGGVRDATGWTCARA